MTLVEELKSRQGERDTRAYAKDLGINEAALARIYRGERLIGESIGRRIVKVYPDLQWIVAGYIMSKNN